MFSRRDFATSIFATCLFGGKLSGQEQQHGSFALRVFGPQGEVPSRLANYETILQANYDRSFFVLRDMGQFAVDQASRPRWALEAERSRGFGIDTTSALDGLAYLVVRGGDPHIVFDEGFMNGAISFSFMIANAQVFGAAPEEIKYWFANLYDAIKWGDPIPYFGGFDYFHRFFVNHDFEYFGEEFFEVFGKTLTTVTTFPMFHEIGHFVLGHVEQRKSVSGQNDWLRSQEQEADEYSIETCSVGLRIGVASGVLYFNAINFLRREFYAANGVTLADTHDDPLTRFEKNMSYLSEIHDQQVAKGLGLLDDRLIQSNTNEIFKLAIDAFRDLGRSRPSFDQDRFGDFEVSSGLPLSYQRFYRRSCNLENYRASSLLIESDDGGANLTLFPDPTSLLPIGRCRKTFIP